MGSTTKWQQFSPFNLIRTQRRPAAGKTYPLKMKPMSSPPLLTITSFHWALLWFRLFSLSLFLSVLNTFTFWDLKCQTERLIKSDLVTQAIRWEPADGAKSFSHILKTGFKAIWVMPDDEVSFPTSYSPRWIMLLCYRYINGITVCESLECTWKAEWVKSSSGHGGT